MEFPRMKPALAAVALIFAAAQPAFALAAPVEAVRPWSRPAAAGGNGVGYLTLVNHGKADTLTGVETPVAQKVEMHASSMAGGVMRMSQEQSLPLPAGGQISFAPGGRHLMLIGLKTSLKSGDRAPATLHFSSGEQLKVEFIVGVAPAAAMPDHMDMH
jgi:copper(I)-binding protein